MNRTIYVSSALVCLVASLWASSANAFHFPWDQAHDTTDWDDPTNPGPCDAPGCDECDSTGSPVYLPTGHLIWSERDAQIAGRPGLQITRVYNSHDPRDGMFGRGWTGGCEPGALEVVDSEIVSDSNGSQSTQSAKSIVVRTRGGKRYTFKQDASGTFAAPVGRYEQVARQADGSIEVAFPDGSRQAFNAAGRMTSETVSGARPIRYEYDDNGRLKRVVDASDRSLAFSYDAKGHVERVKDHSGQEWSYAYDDTGNLTGVTNPAGGTRKFSYEPFSPPGDGFVYQHLVRVTDEAGVVVTNVVYMDERVASYSVGENVYRYTYDLAKRTVRKTDALNSNWTYTYSDAGKITATTYPSGAAIQREYDDSGRLVRFVDPLKNAWTWSYDAEGRLTSETNPLNEASRWEFEGSTPLPVRAISPSGRVTQANFDDRGNLTKVTDPAGAETSLSWSEAGAPMEMRDPSGRTTKVVADASGLPTTIIDHAERMSFIATDAQGRITEVSTSQGDALRFERDALGRITAVVEPSGNRSSYMLDAAGKTLAVSDPSGKTISFEYDTFGRMSARIMSDGRRYQFTYRADNLLATASRPDGVMETFSYDSSKRLTAAAAGGNRISYSYTVRSELASASNSSGTVNFTYDAVGRVATETSNRQPISYRYNADGELSGWTIGDVSNDFTRDQRGLISRVTAPEGNYALEYDALGRRSGLGYPNGVRASYRFGDRDQLEELEYTGPYDETFNYEYDPLGILTRAVSADETWTYEYDRDKQLVAADYGDDKLSFEYDKSGNRLGAGRTYDTANRLTESSDATYTYDQRGRLTAKRARSSGARTEYTWNERSQLITVRSFPNETATTPSETLSFTYGPLGDRWSATRNGTTERYAYVGSDRVLTMDGSSKVIDRATFGPGVDEPLALHGNSGPRFLHANHLGSIVGVSDGSSTLGKYNYGPFGESRQTPTVNNPYRYTAREFERDDLYYYRARYYDPTIGRFLSEDPLGLSAGDANFYRYVGNNPVQLRDPSGQLVWIPIIWAGIEIGLAIYDAYDTTSTILDPCVGAGEKWLAGGLWLAGALLPGGGYSKADDLARWVRRVPCGCFAEGTAVETIDGQRPIESIRDGELVLSRDEATGAVAYKRVTAVHVKANSPLQELTLGTEGENSRLVTTPGHPFWVNGRGWTPAGALKRSDVLASHTKTEGRPISGAAAPEVLVASTQSTTYLGTVYNLTVADFHTYFVGTDGVWVHNQSPCNLAARTLYHGTDIGSAQNLLGGEGLDAAKAAASKLDGPQGFFMATDEAAAEFFALRRSPGGMLQYDLSADAVRQLEAAGARLGPIPQGNFPGHLPGNEFVVPPSAFGLFNELRAAGEIVVRGR